MKPSAPYCGTSGALLDAGRLEDAQGTLLEVESMREEVPHSTPELALWRERMVALYERWGRPDDARRFR